MTHHTHPTSEKAPGAINTEGLTTDTTNDLNSATDMGQSQVNSAQIHLSRMGLK